MFRHKCTQLFRNGKMVKTRYPQERDSLEIVRRTIEYSLEKMRAYTSWCSIRYYKSRRSDFLPQHPSINLGKTDKNTRNGLGKTDFCCGGMASQLSANLAKIWKSQHIIASLQPLRKLVTIKLSCSRYDRHINPCSPNVCSGERMSCISASWFYRSARLRSV